MMETPSGNNITDDELREVLQQMRRVTITWPNTSLGQTKVTRVTLGCVMQQR